MLSYTVVIPLFNKEKYVPKAITSLAFQSKKPKEIIIVDDASTDASLMVAKKCFLTYQAAFAKTKIKFIVLKTNSGPGNARNRGMEEATGDLISFLDADDYYEKEFIATAAHYMHEKQIHFLVAGIKLHPSGINYPETKKIKKHLRPVNNELYLLYNPLFAVSSPYFFMGRGSNVVVFRKYIGAHRYETDSLLNEGVDFWYRVLKSVVENKMAKIGFLTGSYIRVTEVQGSLSRKKYNHWNELKIPPTVSRYVKSTNEFDLQLAGMLSLRWFRHAMNNLSTVKHKVVFVYKHKKIWQRALLCKLKRNFIKKDILKDTNLIFF
jgi:glycosyltransferase involved in cell wall biosynthesis